MKTTTIFYLMMAVLSFAAADASAATTWVDHEARVVSVMPTSVLTTQLVEIKASATEWAILNYDWRYSIPDYERELEALKREYPGYEIVRAKVKALGSNLQFVIRPLDMVVETRLFPESEGAYFHGDVLLDQRQFERLRSAKIAPEAAYALQGQVAVDVVEAEVRERIPLNLTVCEQLSGRSQELREIIANLARAVSELSRRPSGLSDVDRDAWVQRALDQCFAGPGLTWVRSMKDLLATQPRLRQDGGITDYLRIERRAVEKLTAPTWTWRGQNADPR